MKMEPDASRLWIYIVLLAVFTLLRGFVTACEYAVTEVKDSRVRAMEGSEPGYHKLSELLQKPHKLLLTFSMQRSFTSVLISALTLLICDAVVDDRVELALMGVRERSLFRLGLLIVLVILVACLLVVLTDLLPKRLVEQHTEGFAVRCAGVIQGLVRVMTPFSALSYGLAFVLCKLFGVSLASDKDTVTEEEIRLMVDAGNETGAIEESEREMINNIFEFDDVPVSEVMTHRTDFIAVEIDAKIGDVVYLAINEGVSRIPVYEQTVDNILGIIYIKDLLCLVGCDHSDDFTLRNFKREVQFVPDLGKCRDVFQQMRRAKQHMAIVVDEYGGTAGLVTMEDLLEEIVGNIQDEYDNEATELEQLSENVYSVDGAADPEEILPKLGATVPTENCYDTMSALVADLLGRIPAAGETPSVQYQNLRLTVVLTEDNWISRLKAERLREIPVE